MTEKKPAKLTDRQQADLARAEATANAVAITFLCAELERLSPGAAVRIARRIEDVAASPRRTQPVMMERLAALAAEIRSEAKAK